MKVEGFGIMERVLDGCGFELFRLRIGVKKLEVKKTDKQITLEKKLLHEVLHKTNTRLSFSSFKLQGAIGQEIETMSSVLIEKHSSRGRDGGTKLHCMRSVLSDSLPFLWGKGFVSSKGVPLCFPR